MQLSQFGQKFTGTIGVTQLMDDLGKALSSGAEMLMLGAGNPAYISEVQTHIRQHMYEMMLDEGRFEHMVGDYGSPQGNIAFARALAELLQDAYGWDIGPEHIAITNGSQMAFFYLFNMFAGPYPDGSTKKILLPLAPEYIGYADVGISTNLFLASKPEIEHLDDRLFKYRVNFDNLPVGDDIGAICVSRPTNPTGNVITDEEMAQLSKIACDLDIPFIVDNAYGAPFPNILFTDAKLLWNENVILSMSLSKLGLPGARTGIVVAQPPVIEAIASMNAVCCLAPSNLGAALVLDLVRSGEILNLSQNLIRPYYQQKAGEAVDMLRKYMADTTCYIHKPEGAFFLWLWFKDIPITSGELYERLKARGVIVVPGHYFFPGLDEPWQHRNECIRMSYAQEAAVVEKGIEIIAEEVRRAYGE